MHKDTQHGEGRYQTLGLLLQSPLLYLVEHPYWWKDNPFPFGVPVIIRFTVVHMSNESPHGKTNNLVSDQVRHKPTCTVTEKSYNLEISDLSRGGTVLSE